MYLSMENRYVFILIFILSLFDAIAVNSSYALVWLLHTRHTIYPDFNFRFFIIVNTAWLLSALANRLYRYSSVQTISKMSYKSALTYCCQALIIGVCVSQVKGAHGNEITVLYLLSAQLLAFTLIRIFIFFIQQRSLKLKTYRKKIAIVGYNEVSEKLADFFQQNQLAYNFAGHYKRVNETNAKSKLENLKANIKFAIEYQLDEVYTTLFPEDCEGLDKVIKLAEQHCIRVKFITTNVKYKYKIENFTGGSNYNLNGYYNGIPILVNRPEPLGVLKNRILKRGFDIVFSLFVIVFLLSWLMPLLSILIKLESAGPTIFMQLRSGRNNKPFWCYKFRSMKVNDESNVVQATKNDLRVTTIGAFMRKTSIDELPQFFNVLLGNMSIVGPRPHMLKHTDEYREIIDQYMVRLFLKPGITGWAQVNGFRGETRDPEQMQSRVGHDIWYMEHWSLAHDIKIVYKTVFNAVKGENNAY